MNLEELFDKTYKMAEEHSLCLFEAVRTKADMADALELVSAAESAAVFTLANAHGGELPGDNETQRKLTINRALGTDPPCIAARKVAKSTEIAYYLAEVRVQGTKQLLNVLLAGLNNLAPTPIRVSVGE